MGVDDMQEALDLGFLEEVQVNLKKKNYIKSKIFNSKIKHLK